jgi:uncharacterized protein YjcR
MFHASKTQDPQEQRRKALRAKNLMLDGYKYKVIESTLRVSMKTLRQWAEIHGIQLDSKIKTS